jgi:hypothetical protein
MRKFLWVIGQVLALSFFFGIGVSCLFLLINSIVDLIDNFDWIKFLSFIVITIPASFLGFFLGFYNFPEGIREIMEEYKRRGEENVTPIPLVRKKGE